MVKSKKLLSLFLAVVMVLSVFTVMASAAYTRGEAEGTADIDVKYTVEKVDVIPESPDGASAELAGDNFYAVTVWMKSAKPVDTFMVPFHYNKTLFAPVTLTDGEITYPVGAGMDPETYVSEMGDGVVYAYTFGDYMNNTGMYKANGTTATTKALAKCIGLGNENSAGIAVTCDYVSPDHPLYNKWGAGLSATTGVVFANLDVACNQKTAYFNTIEGVATYTDWVNMFTIYFEAIAEDVVGAEFGVFTDDCFTLDGSYDGKGLGYFQSATNYESLVPSFNVVSNAVVEAAAEPSPVFAKTSQIRYNGPVDGDYAPFDVRTRAAMTADDFAAICGNDPINAIDKVGFVYADSTVGMTLANAEAVIAGGAVDGCVDVPVEHIQTKDGEYIWTCLLEDANYADAVDAVGYIVVNGETYFFDAVTATDFSELYETWAEKIPQA